MADDDIKQCASLLDVMEIIGMMRELAHIHPPTRVVTMKETHHIKC